MISLVGEHKKNGDQNITFALGIKVKIKIPKYEIRTF